MSQNKVACPQCGAVLMSDIPIPTGKKARCPSCNTLFRTGRTRKRRERRSRLPATPLVAGVLLLAVVGLVLAVQHFSRKDAALALAPGEAQLVPGIPSLAPTGSEYQPVGVSPAAKTGPGVKNDVQFKKVETPGRVATKPVKSGSETARGTLSTDLQQRVNAAIDKGAKFLIESQQEGGTWPGSLKHEIGYSALPGLTLLECEVEPSSPTVQKTALHVRAHANQLTQTYHIALAILFLDRLGDPQDRELIRRLALRLIAGQNERGGWTYSCPTLTVAEERTLLAFLQTNKPKRLPVAIGGKERQLSEAIGKGSRASQPPLASSIPGSPTHGTNSLADRDKGNSTTASASTEPKKETPAPKPLAAPARLVRVENLPARLRGLPVVQDKIDLRRFNPTTKLPPPARKSSPKINSTRDDNSNTQFALLALWAARRHDVPMERTVVLVERRFRSTQDPDGSWSYSPYSLDKPQNPDTMTCVGLLGLAMGHGVEADWLASAATSGSPVLKATAVQDDAIQRGLKALGEYIPAPNVLRSTLRFNAYFLWSVERVGVLYNLKTIGNKDWYRAGVDLLLPAQKSNGAWFGNRYHGSTEIIDTCMALLFLRRANLMRDLSENLRLNMAIVDPDGKH